VEEREGENKNRHVHGKL